MDTEIHKLSPERKDDFFYLFDKLAFTDNPDWAPCYCQFYHTDSTDPEWENRTANQNRERSGFLIESGEMHGFLAYKKGMPVAWCHADDRSKLKRLRSSEGNEEGNLKIGAVVCFVVAPDYRHQGLATRLLQYAIDDFARRGYDVFEAYPKLEGKADAENYHGPLRMYLKQGFVKVRENDAFAVVRKMLKSV